MARSEGKNAKARIYLCECGPIIKGGLDLDLIAGRVGPLENVSSVQRYPTLCSEEGRQWLEQEMAAHLDSRLVVAGCSPREHGATFMEVCRKAGVNPYLMTMANIREQCIWVTADSDSATGKAEEIVRAALARVLRQKPLEEKEIDCCTDALVIGAGVTGLTTARLLADSGRQVCLVESAPAIGGRAALLSEVYPGLECGSCMLEPLMDEVLHHLNIECLTYSEVDEVLGDFGNYTVKIRQRARHVDPSACYGCRTCSEACPAEAPNRFDEGLSRNKAIHVPYAGALPNVSLVDRESCLRFQGEECNACSEACPFGAVDLDMPDETIERRAGAVVIATGAGLGRATTAGAARTGEGTLPEGVGEGTLPEKVLTASAFERLLNASGPTGGALNLPDRSEPRSIALIHCFDGEGTAPAESCSKVCCMAFAKYIDQIRQKLPQCEIHEILWERCAGGKGFREFFTSAVNGAETLRQIWLGPEDRLSGLIEEGGKLRAFFSKDGAKKELDVDLAVVAPPLVGSRGSRDLARLMRLETDRQGFFLEDHERLLSFKTRVEGIFVAGCAQGPKDIQESAVQGAAAAGGVMSALVPGRKLLVDPATSAVEETQCGGCRTCVLTCPYEALRFDDEKNAAVVNELLCRGCGSCAAACPCGAIKARHFEDEQITAEITALMK